MHITRHLVSRQAVLHAVTLIVALCSFAYELAYAELLTVTYGGTVTQYSLTIGLFFFSLGVGSYLVRHLDETRSSNFFRTEIYIAVAAPLGFLFIILIDATQALAGLPLLVEQVTVRGPVIVVGVLSGLELPMLLSMVEREADATDPLPGAVRTLVSAADTVAHRVVSLWFHTDRDGGQYNTYASVLAMDYLGGLCGALVFVFYLYPELGVISSVVGLALLNCLAALLFVGRFSGQTWSPFSARTDDRTVVTRERLSAVLFCVFLTLTFTGAVVQSDTVNSEVTGYYMENTIEQEYPRGTIDATVTDQYTTPYQQVTYYNRTWVGDGENTAFDGESERCLRLGTAVQLCESWADSYHSGLVDVPLSMYENSTETDVLVLGGGDWIAADSLRAHNVSVDLVDPDRAFMSQARTDDLLQQYHDDAYEYDALTVHHRDAFEFVTNTADTYDVILLDLPGATDDDLMRLYSTEFYTALAERLTRDGVVATWTYTRYAFPEHYRAYLNTVADAGFSSSLQYWAYDDLNADGSEQLGERFAMFAPDDTRPTPQPANGTAYVRQHAEAYQSLGWLPTPTYDGYEPNSIFQPNYNIIVEPGV